MHAHSWWPRALIGLATALTALAVASAAWAHAEISPPVAKSKATELFTLAVPTEKKGLTTTKVELTTPSGFGIDSFVPSPGWRRAAKAANVTWSGGKTPTQEDAVFQFLATPGSTKTYTFEVRQTYSDGSVVDWSGPESSDTPAPVIEAKSSLGGGGSSALAIVALAVGAVGVILAGVALATRGGSRPLA